jgi:uncharacterized protein
MAAKRDRALITGASAGIGEAFAERLARDGWDLIITARRRERLEALAERLAKETDVEVDVIAADLSEPDGIAAVEERAASDERLALLINNAGFGGYRPFVELDPLVAEDLINVHITATVRASRAALPGMIERKRGAIVTIASLLGYSGTVPAGPLPQRVIYAAAKSFQVAFTQLLAGELAGGYVRAMVVCPGVVKTEFHEVQNMDMSHLPRMSPDDIVTATLAGLEAGEIVCIPSLEDRSLIPRLGEAERAVIGASRPAEGEPLRLASRYTKATLEKGTP